MKTFSDLLATDTSALLDIVVELREHGHVQYLADINGTVLLVGQTQLQVDLFAPINLRVQLTEFAEGTSGIEVAALTINGLEVLPVYQQLASSHNNYIDQLGLWSFNIPSPFYNWYHTVSGQGWLLTPDK